MKLALHPFSMQTYLLHFGHLADLLLMVTGLSSPQGHLSGMLETGTFADAPDVLASAADVLAAIGAAPTAKPDASVAKPDVPAAKPDVPACEFIEIATTNGPELVTVITVEVAG